VRAQDRAGQVASQAQDRVSDLTDRAQYQTQRANDELQRMLRQNPLTVGALAVGVGAAIGLALPQTRREHEVMGEARDTLVEKAQEKAEETQEKVQRVAEEGSERGQGRGRDPGPYRRPVERSVASERVVGAVARAASAAFKGGRDVSLEARQHPGWVHRYTLRVPRVVALCAPRGGCRPVVRFSKGSRAGPMAHCRCPVPDRLRRERIMSCFLICSC
jgi:ElaB/YqjD/DUF883 family membrane-anchored ribosome-binding protein